MVPERILLGSEHMQVSYKSIGKFMLKVSRFFVLLGKLEIYLYSTVLNHLFFEIGFHRFAENFRKHLIKSS